MTTLPTDRQYSKTHEWLQIDGNTITIGITDHAQEQLGDLVFVQLPKVGDKFSAGDELLTLESVKAAADVYSPANATVIEINATLEDSPETINSNPYETWLVKLEAEKTNELDGILDSVAYQQYLASQS